MQVLNGLRGGSERGRRVIMRLQQVVVALSDDGAYEIEFDTVHVYLLVKLF